MTLSRSLLYSLAGHALLLALLLLWAGFSGPEAVPQSDTLKIRIRMSALPQRSARRFTGAPPAASSRDRNSRPSADQTAPRPPVSSMPLFDHQSRPAGFSSAHVALNNTRLVRDLQNVPLLDNVPSLDPLAGMDLPAVPNLESAESSPGPSPAVKAAQGSWSLSWQDGSERGIISFPEIIAPDEFSSAGKHLQATQVNIEVSPQGNVVAAEVEPPGSGDIRIDRYLYSLAFQLILEPADPAKENQKGSIRLVFQEGAGR